MKSYFVIMIAAMFLALSACEQKQQTNTEKVMDRVDDALDRRSDEKAHDIAEDISDKVDDALDRRSDEEIRDAAEDISDELSDELKDAAKEIEEKTKAATQ